VIVDPISWEDPSRNTSLDTQQRLNLLNNLQHTSLSVVEACKSFPRFVQTTYIRKFITRHEIYKLISNTHGNIVECGVLSGDGLFAWAHFVEIYEPFNHLRQVVGFDSFEGFPQDMTPNEKVAENLQMKQGGLERKVYEELNDSIETFDLNRPLKHIKRMRLIKGDACQTIPEFLTKNPEFLVSLLWLDFDVFQPTAVALKSFVSRMHAGSVIAFDELNHPLWPGETIAVLENLDLRKFKVERFPFGSTVSFIRFQ
jgi:hypothetical protein